MAFVRIEPRMFQLILLLYLTMVTDISAYTVKVRV
jgi:hypothetical protein